MPDMSRQTEISIFADEVELLAEMLEVLILALTVWLSDRAL